MSLKRKEDLSEMRCPKCKSERIVFDLGGATGKYKCKDCGYLGPLIIEDD